MKMIFNDIEALKRWMADKVESHVKAWKSDFYEYDVPEIEKNAAVTTESGKESVFFWVVRENGTFFQDVVSESAEEARCKTAIIHQFPKAHFYMIHFRYVNDKVHYVFETITAKTLERRIQKMSA